VAWLGGDGKSIKGQGGGTKVSLPGVDWWVGTGRSTWQGIRVQAGVFEVVRLVWSLAFRTALTEL